MNYRIMFVSGLLFLAACNDSKETEQSTFIPPKINPVIPGPVIDPVKVDPVKPVPVVDPVKIGPSPFQPDNVVEDKTLYSGAIDANVDISSVSETPSVKNHEMIINGKTVKYTARAGHLIAYTPKDPKHPERKQAQAAIFYMAYTRDDLPRENRPVTFFFNGGPGSASVWLHLGSWAPKRLKTGIPNIPEEFYAAKPQSMPWIDNEETLLDKTDLVFLDPAGTGLSTAIAPYKNNDFWGMDADARVNTDFVTRYVNFYNRQSSPKYLYGESYGGIRAPIMANLMEAAGTTDFEQDRSGKKPVVLTGVVLNSPILNYETNCGQDGDISCAGFLPTEGMVADYYQKGTMRGAAAKLDYVDTLRTFVRDKYNAARDIWYDPVLASAKATYNRADFQLTHLKTYWNNAEESRAWAALPARKENALSYATSLANLLIANRTARQGFIDQFVVDPYTALQDFTDDAKIKADGAVTDAWRDYAATPAGRSFVDEMTAITGLGIPWATEFELSSNGFMKKIKPDSNLGIYDARANIPKQGGYDITFYEDEAFQAAIKDVLPDVFNYRNGSVYSTKGDVINRNWRYERAGKQLNARSSLPDLVSMLNYDPSVKLLALHGYYDMVTPFHQTELDLAGAGLGRRVPVRNFEGGHMFYYAEEARAPAKKALEEFYDAPAWGSKPALVTNTATVLN
ncbi:S10 family serine carboxypeptidase-like protein [Phyllobacterium endophyticum]|uniref:Peptidase n=1 Tax=Phyllobacterium endophyticum TaxID=1149773 RepID=A0A2P7AU88_9HYPH|nr:peptidase [Phyllobacterium endophyticum]MBB3234225.1 carboxypeptidase C (cathepsin A) [Phyllobacterium endophyticum]PSH57776.1 peptidase [Phyllobacterium endophyticum]TYR43975.1 peptidase [Phyllobacterium endophyticum]